MTLRTITTAGMTVLLALSVAACSKSSAGTQDQQLTQAAQSKINADSSLQGDGIQVAVSNGVATLTGTAANNAARNAAAQDAQVQGVTQV
ncbi:MAG: BON domain-containing protein, partial [Terriglobales bacterium]